MPKKKGDLGGNPSPVQTPEFLAHIKTAPDLAEGVKLSSKMTSVRLPDDVDGYVRSLPNRAAWLRRVITEAVQRELKDRK
jgi:hypothetical protein